MEALQFVFGNFSQGFSGKVSVHKVSREEVGRLD